MQPGPTAPGGYLGTSAATPLWASLIARFDTIFHDQGLPDLGFANDLLYHACGNRAGRLQRHHIEQQRIVFLYGGRIDAGRYDITLTGLCYQATPGYDLTSGLGSRNGILLVRALTAIAHAQMSFTSSPDMLDVDGYGHWSSGVDQTLIFQTMSARDVDVVIQAGAGAHDYASRPGAAYAWISQLERFTS